jgi:membrane-anchored protein YejM (alkaline phosphatase superfamily)
MKQEGNMHYPLEPIRIDRETRPPNILIIALDSVRHGMITEAVAPNIYGFGRDALRFTNHFSGGNATRFGIFSLFYGLNPGYWFSVLNEYRSPVLIDTMQQLDYRMKIVSSANLTWPEFRRTVFVNVQEHIVDEYNSNSVAKRDELATAEFAEWLEGVDTADSRPFFGFLFLDAPHQETYPAKGFSKFTPDSGGKKNYLTMKNTPEEREILMNQYKNSIHYDDFLLGEVFKTIRERGLDNNTVIIVTSDHGEEIFEHGNFGHNSSFCDEQVQSFMIMRVPGKGKGDIGYMTSHMDIPATLMQMMGVQNDPRDFSMGGDIFDRNFKRDFSIVGNWNWFSFIFEKHKLVFSMHADPMFGTRVYDARSYEQLESSLVDNYTDSILRVMNENTRFYKK